MENALLIMRFTWCSNDRLLLKMTPRLQMCEEGDVNGEEELVCVWFWGGIRHQ